MVKFKKGDRVLWDDHGTQLPGEVMWALGENGDLNEKYGLSDKYVVNIGTYNPIIAPESELEADE